MERNVLYTATRNIYEEAIVSMKSLLHHTKVDNVFFFVEDDPFPYKLPSIVKTINVAGQKWFPANGANFRSRCTYMVLMRVIAMEYVKVDNLLSIDYDTIVKKDASGIFDYDLSDNYFAAVKEPNKRFWGLDAYYNFGVALLNLKKLDEIKEIVVRLLNSGKFDLAEQDVLNILCQNKVLELPQIYNANRYTGQCKEEEIVIKHYPGFYKLAFFRDPDYVKYNMTTWDKII